jgi:hypothetical protein
MFELKPIAKEALPRALEKAEQYRVLNEPLEAESICLDILEVDPKNERAIVTLLLALTDQFRENWATTSRRAHSLLARLPDGYSRAYYKGIILERSAKAHVARGEPGARYLAFDELRDAMHEFDLAIASRPAGNEDSVLRWNACARFLERHPEVRHEPAGDAQEHMLE